MRNEFVLLGTVIFALFSSMTSADTVEIGGVAMPPIDNSEAFKHVQKRVGKWQGTMTQGSSGQVIDVSYEWKVTSGGNTITETIIEDGVEMLTTYSDLDGELVARHYCALGTEPVFRVSKLSDHTLELKLDPSASGLHAHHDDFVTQMAWTMKGKDDNMMSFKNTVMLDGQLTENTAELKRVQ